MVEILCAWVLLEVVNNSAAPFSAFVSRKIITVQGCVVLRHRTLEDGQKVSKMAVEVGLWFAQLHQPFDDTVETVDISDRAGDPVVDSDKVNA